ncbi:WD40 repeat-like protein [Acrodontium crateriforme]|uniref:WD40 repeat-like protein n=1 Tax=Acrodontium crateriforme TaxID=150365 RepID=A0AAQ3R549_9PEZI|nr:WD40 repeat-like protein [Acrodontium crateriforme]
MKATPLLVAWHEDNAPIYSAHFEPNGKGRLATAGGDHHVRLWKVDATGDERKVTYLSTLTKHTQAVNVVRWCPKGEVLASAGDDGNVLLWVPSESPAFQSNMDENQEDVEHWRVKTMCRSSSGAEIYDLAWSPDGSFFITGSMDNVARIYNATNGQTVRQIAEHNHYVQGVAWDPLNEYVATQSSDRSVHIYTLKTKDGQFTLAQHNKVTKMDLPGKRIPSNSPAPDFGNFRASFVQDAIAEGSGSPRPSAPGTPQSLALPMNPPPTSHSRRSSFGSQMGHSIRRSVSPSPSSMPLPAVMPSASPSLSGGIGLGTRNTNIYANETFTSFFRRLTFTPDGSLLFTPAGQFKTTHPSIEGLKQSDDIINTVYIYTRAGLNKPPVAYLPGHKKPSIAVKCSPIYYNIRPMSTETKEITIDTRTEEDIAPLPEPVVPSKPSTSHSTMDPPPLAPSPSPSVANMASPRNPIESESSPITPNPLSGPPPAFNLPYRLVYAVATQDAVLLFDTQQQKPLCIVSNLHFATFTDLTWSNDGLTLLMTSSDGFCSTLTFAPGELGTVYQPPPPSAKHTPTPISVAVANSTTSTPQATPTAPMTSAPLSAPIARQASQPSQTNTMHQYTTPSGQPSPSPFPPNPSNGRASPARSMSVSSIATEVPDQNAPPPMNNPTPTMSSMPSVAAAGSGLPLFTPPQTPGAGHVHSGSISSVTSNVPSAALSQTPADSAAVAGAKRANEGVQSGATDAEQGREKRRRIAPTLVSGSDSVPAVSSQPSDTSDPPGGQNGQS